MRETSLIRWGVGVLAGVVTLLALPAGALGASIYVLTSGWAGEPVITKFETGFRSAADVVDAGLVPVPPSEDFVFAPDATTVYLAGDDQVTPIVPTRGVTDPAITVRTSPESRIAIAPDDGTLLVTDPADGVVTPIDLSTRTAGRPLGVPGAAAVAISPDGATGYVSGSDAGLTPIDVRSGAIGTSIPLAFAATAVSVTPDGTYAVVAGATASAGAVQIVDLATRAAQPPIALGGDPASHLTMAADGRTAEVSDTAGAVWTVDIAGRQARKIIAGNGHDLNDIAMTADGLLLVSDQDCTDPNANRPVRCFPHTQIVDLDGGPGAGGPAYAGRIRPAPEPTATFAAGNAYPGESTPLDAGDSSNTGGSVTSYTWDFGDGTPALTSSSPATTHTYANSGTYTAKLTTSNRGGCATRIVYTGQSEACSGRAVATTTRTIVVAPRPLPPTGVPPVAHTFAATGVTSTTARLTGSVDNPAGWSSYFEYGSTNRYGQRTPTRQAQNATAGIAPVAETIGGLRPHHRYHYRLVVAKADGAVLSAGDDATFTTHTAGAVALRSTALRVSGRRVAVLVRCSGLRACRGSITTLARVRSGGAHPHSVACGTARVSLAAGHDDTIRVPVGTRCRALLRHHRQLAGQVRTHLTTGQRDRTRAVRLIRARVPGRQ